MSLHEKLSFLASQKELFQTFLNNTYILSVRYLFPEACTSDYVGFKGRKRDKGDILKVTCHQNKYYHFTFYENIVLLYCVSRSKSTTYIFMGKRFFGDRKPYCNLTSI